MDNNEPLTATALRAIAVAQGYSHHTVTLEHILFALLERNEVQNCLKNMDINQKKIEIELCEFLDGIDIAKSGNPERTKEFDILLARTVAYSQFTTRRLPTGVDILFQIITYFEQSFACKVLRKFGLTPDKLKNYMFQGTRQPHNEYTNDAEPSDKNEAIDFIRKYCSNLNEMANIGKIDPVIGRLSEINRVIQIIARRTKNNVILVGESGVGKTSIAEGIAYNITQGNIPKVFQKSTIWSLDIASLVAGTRFRGDFEERLKFLLKSLSIIEDEEPILFIDEIHTIMDAGSGNKGSLDVSNLIKPALAKGKLRCIGSTTHRDWRQHFEKDRALLRRFKKIIIDEPSVEDTKLILRGVKNHYELFHNVTYTDAALDAAVILTHKYISGKLPDKAIDMIDEAGARQRIIDDSPKTIIEQSDIEYEVSLISKIPEQMMRNDEKENIRNIEQHLKTFIFGQDTAIQKLSDAVMISRAGLRETNKPQGCYLFIGPTGVGKTQLARELAKILNLPLIKFDMSEYMEKHTVSKLIGAPPGYLGFEDGESGNGLLINEIDNKPACVLLLDEIEKAHVDIFNILLQVMDDASLTASNGKNVDFRNVIIVMTSNVGVAAMDRESIGFLPSSIEIKESDVKEMFSPEFRNRLDAIVPFNSLRRHDMLLVVDKFINELRQMVEDKNLKLELTDDARNWLAEKGYDAIYGARPLKRLITEKIKLPLSKIILFGNPNNALTISIKDDDIELED